MIIRGFGDFPINFPVPLVLPDAPTPTPLPTDLLDRRYHYQFQQGRESVSLYHRWGAATETIPDAKALPQNNDEREKAWGCYLYDQVDWRLPWIQVSQEPLPGDTITSASGSYVIQTVDRPHFNNVWRAYTIALVAFNDVVTWKSRRGSPTATGARVVQTTASQTGLQCRYQPDTDHVGDMYDKRGFVKYGFFYMMTDIPIQFGDQLVGQSANLTDGSEGVIYEVVKVDNHERIDQLLRISTRITF